MLKTFFQSRVLFALLFLPFGSFAVNTNIDYITIYSSGAEVHRTASTNVSKGTSEIVLKGLSNYIQQNSIQVNTSNNVSVLSATFRLNHLENQPINASAQRLKDSIEILDLAMESLNNRETIAENEKAMLDLNRKIGGENSGTNVTELTRGLDLYRTRMAELMNAKLVYAREKQKLQLRRNAFQQQFQEATNSSKDPLGEIVLLVSSDVATNSEINFSYLVSNAGWSPLYDLKSNGSKEPIKIVYKANVFQNSGEEWKDVHLIISSSNPTTNNSLPVLNTKYLDFQQQIQYDMSVAGSRAAPRSTMQVEGAYYKKALADKNYAPAPTQTLEQNITATQSEISVDYAINLPYSIPSDGKSHLVSMQEKETKGDFEYFTIPKMDKEVFLTVNVPDWNSLNILPGDANIFHRGNFVGKYYLAPNATEDTLRLSFGKDKKILVEKKCDQSLTKKAIIGNSKKQTFTHQITVQNNNKEAIDMVVLDQIPVSKNTEIEVEALEISGAEREVETGILTWKLKMNAGENRKLKITYSVKSPKDKVLTGL